MSESEDLANVELDKITEIRFGNDAFGVEPGAIWPMRFDLDPEHPVPGIGFLIAGQAANTVREAVYAPIDKVTLVITKGDARTQDGG